MAKLRVITNFRQLKDLELVDLSSRVEAGLYSQGEVYPSPPVTAEALSTAGQALADAVALAADGSRVLRERRKARRQELDGLLRQLAAYVQSLCHDDRELVLSAGFESASFSRSRTELAPPRITRIDPSVSAELRVRVSPVSNARSYEAQIHNGTGEVWAPAGVFTQARAMRIAGLVPGSTYTIRVRAVGGTTGYSAWSHPIAQMSL